MQRILILGAGFSAPCLIQHLLGRAEEADFRVTVADLDPGRAERAVQGHRRGRGLGLDARDAASRRKAVEDADLVISFLYPALHLAVAEDCLEARVPLVTASYVSKEFRALDAAAREAGILFLGEMGLDPGIDHMSTMELLARIHGEGGEVTSFRSYGAGVADGGAHANPLGYYVTWNPKNVATAGKDGAQWLEHGALRLVHGPELFRRTWPVEVPGVGMLEAYPNRDSLGYRETFGLPEVQTLIRATLRHPGFCEVWAALGELGWSNDALAIVDLSRRTVAELTAALLQTKARGEDLARTAAERLGVSRTGAVMERLSWLGLFRDDPVPIAEGTLASVFAALIERRLHKPETGRDLVILQHDLEVRYPREGGRRERVISSLVQRGEIGGHNAMARTVGLPAAIGAELILSGQIRAKGVQIPTVPEIYEPVLKALASHGIAFREFKEPLPAL